VVCSLLHADIEDDVVQGSLMGSDVLISHTIETVVRLCNSSLRRWESSDQLMLKSARQGLG